MSMTRKDFVALANALRNGLPHKWDNCDEGAKCDNARLVDTLIAFCRTQNPRFNEQRWRDYLAGKCGPGGGRK